MSMKNSNDTIGNPTHDIPTCSSVAKPTGLRRALRETYVRKMTEVGQSGPCEWLERTGLAIVRDWTILEWS